MTRPMVPSGAVIMVVLNRGISEELVTHREAIQRSVRGIVRDAAVAEDLTQETLLRAREKLGAALRDACTFSADERGVLICEPKPPKTES